MEEARIGAGIFANIARKVDRLEYVLDGASVTRDEPLFDTTVDLLIYTLKYQTHLADQDERVANTLFARSDVTPPYSDGPAGFEALLDNVKFTHLERASKSRVRAAASHLGTAFADVTTCIEAGAMVPVTTRAERAAALTHAAVILVGSLIYETPEQYDDFLRTNLAAHDAS